VVAVLEGGYDLDGIAESTAAVVGRLLDRPAAPSHATARPGFDRLLDAWRSVQAPLWPAVKP
jgi:acetoin utilization deacetylase AcuC-like enzyme